MSSGSQTQFWLNFTTLKRNAIFVNRYHAKVEAADRRLSMFSAIASSSSIAAWVIWKEASIVWAFVIAASQVLTVLKPYLPYKARLHALSTLGPDLDGLALAAEEEWFAVSHGMLTDEETHKLTMSLKKKSQLATNKAFKGMSLPDNLKLEAIAEREAIGYMATIAGDEDEFAETSTSADDSQKRIGTSDQADGRANAESVAAQTSTTTQEVRLS